MLSPRSALLLLVLACLPGCGGGPSGGPNADQDGGLPPPGVETAFPKRHDSMASDANEQAEPTRTPAADDQGGSSEDSGQQLVDNATADAAAAQAAASCERLLLLVSGGPLIVDLVLSVEGEPHEAALKGLVSEELAASDINRDGQTTWKEIANSTRYRYGQFRYNPVPQMRMYDGNADGLVQPGELLRFLTRNAGPTQSFALRTSNRNRYGSQSTVMELLDDDADGAVAGEEMEKAAARLLSFDADDDEMVRLADLKVDYVRPSLMMSSQRPEQAEMALRINAQTDWNYAWYSLAELYGDGTRLAAKDLALLSAEDQRLDADRDGMVSAKEAKGLQEVPPHLVLRASFGELRKSGETPRTRLRVESLSECLEAVGPVATEHIRRVSLTLPNAQVQFLINEDPMLYNATVEKVDVNDDGKITEYEIGSFLDRHRPVVRGLVRTWVAGQEDPLFAALDTDGDGVLSARELQWSAERLKSLDRDGDGRLASHELPDTMIVAVLRGHPLEDDQMFVHAASGAASRRSGPPWFTAMDANQDGEISHREFLGTPGQFEQLDRDTDGFIGRSEAIMARGTDGPTRRAAP